MMTEVMGVMVASLYVRSGSTNRRVGDNVKLSIAHEKIGVRARVTQSEVGKVARYRHQRAAACSGAGSRSLNSKIDSKNPASRE